MEINGYLIDLVMGTPTKDCSFFFKVILQIDMEGKNVFFNLFEKNQYEKLEKLIKQAVTFKKVQVPNKQFKDYYRFSTGISSFQPCSTKLSFAMMTLPTVPNAVAAPQSSSKRIYYKKLKYASIGDDVHFKGKLTSKYSSQYEFNKTDRKMIVDYFVELIDGEGQITVSAFENSAKNVRKMTDPNQSSSIKKYFKVIEKDSSQRNNSITLENGARNVSEMGSPEQSNSIIKHYLMTSNCSSQHVQKTSVVRKLYLQDDCTENNVSETIKGSLENILINVTYNCISCQRPLEKELIDEINELNCFSCGSPIAKCKRRQRAKNCEKYFLGILDFRTSKGDIICDLELKIKKNIVGTSLYNKIMDPGNDIKKIEQYLMNVKTMEINYSGKSIEKLSILEEKDNEGITDHNEPSQVMNLPNTVPCDKRQRI